MPKRSAASSRPARSVADKKSLIHTLRFPAQQHKLSPGKQIVDPATKGSPGTIVAIDDVTGTLQPSSRAEIA